MKYNLEFYEIFLYIIKDNLEEMLWRLPLAFFIAVIVWPKTHSPNGQNGYLLSVCLSVHMFLCINLWIWLFVFWSVNFFISHPMCHTNKEKCRGVAASYQRISNICSLFNPTLHFMFYDDVTTMTLLTRFFVLFFSVSRLRMWNIRQRMCSKSYI